MFFVKFFTIMAIAPIVFFLWFDLVKNLRVHRIDHSVSKFCLSMILLALASFIFSVV